MSVTGNSYDPNAGVRRVIITTEPVLHPFSQSANAANNYYCLAFDMKGFQYQIDLQAMPPGVSLDQIKPNQVWWVEKRTTLYRLYLYAGCYDTTTRQIDSTCALPPAQSTRYYANVYDTTIQKSATPNNTLAMTYNNTSDVNGFTVVSGSRITAANTGYYNIQYSAQFQKTNASPDTVNVWLRQNGTDVPWTSGEITIAGSSLSLPSWTFLTKMNAKDYVELMWTSTDANTQIFAGAPGGGIGPQIPSISVVIILV